MKTCTPSLEESLARIAALDLEAVKFKLVREHPHEWNATRADAAEIIYKRFLQLCVMHPEQCIVPTADVDDMWHQHILDTRAYARDCEHALGFFLHHWPYAGLLNHEDALELQANFAATCALYINEFGEPYSAEASGTSCDRSCGRDCDRGASSLAERVRPRLRSSNLTVEPSRAR